MDSDDVRNHVRKFFDVVDKLGEMDVEINPDLLAIMLLYSLPTENFRCAIESRDELLSPKTLRIKIIEESYARRSDTRTIILNAIFANKQTKQGKCGLTLNINESKFDCDICLRGKMTRAPSPKKYERVTELLDIIHADVCGPMRVQSNGGAIS